MKNLMLMLIIMLLLSADCQSVDVKSESVELNNNDKIIPAQNPCEYLKNIDEHLNHIINEPSKFVNDNARDECVISLLDSLHNRSLSSEDHIYLKAIDKICMISDGYVSEHLSNIAVKQYYHNLKPLITFLVNEEVTYIQKFVIWGLSMEVSVGGDVIMKKIMRHAKEVKPTLTNEENSMLEDILAKIDPTIMD